ncbi:MAG: hypothetical protein FVQ81_02155 [Candidatus Glassbacteria bacterium]|nr:hypothetical protein [Candidatus Glassbacteria bacterium]
MSGFSVAPGMSEAIFRAFGGGYEKPRIEKEVGMRFPLDLIESTTEGTVCKQCSSCHGCR